jgi:Protein of unknown function (DUF3108)
MHALRRFEDRVRSRSSDDDRIRSDDIVCRESTGRDHVRPIDTDPDRRAALGSLIGGAILFVSRSASLPAAVAAANPAHAAGAAGTKIPVNPAALELSYAGYWGDTADSNARIASARYQFRPSGGEYQLSMRITSALANLNYESAGLLDEAGLHPRRYSENRRLPLRDGREKFVNYDEAERADGDGVLTGDRMTVPRGTQDRVSLLMQVSLLARAYPKRFTPGSEVQMHYATLTQVGAVTMKIGAAEDIRIGGGTVSAQRVQRAQQDSRGSIDFWLGTDALRTPVVIRFEDDGHSLRFVKQD